MPLAAIESVFGAPVTILPDKANPSGDQRYRAIGTTSDGRKAFIVFTLRAFGRGMRLRPISARFMHRKEVLVYEKAYPDV